MHLIYPPRMLIIYKGYPNLYKMDFLHLSWKEGLVRIGAHPVSSIQFMVPRHLYWGKKTRVTFIIFLSQMISHLQRLHAGQVPKSMRLKEFHRTFLTCTDIFTPHNRWKSKHREYRHTLHPHSPHSQCICTVGPFALCTHHQSRGAKHTRLIRAMDLHLHFGIHPCMPLPFHLRICALTVRLRSNKGFWQSLSGTCSHSSAPLRPQCRASSTPQCASAPLPI